MKKQPEITEQTRKNIISAFCDLYEQKPIEQISVKEVITAAGYNRSTFYEYFDDIYALLAYIENDVINYIKANYDNSRHDQNDILQLMTAKENYLKVLFGPYGCIHFQDRLKKEFMSNIEIQESESRFQPYLSEFHITVSLSIYRLWLKRNKDISMGELSKLIHTLYSKGALGFDDSGYML